MVEHREQRDCGGELACGVHWQMRVYNRRSEWLSSVASYDDEERGGDHCRNPNLSLKLRSCSSLHDGSSRKHPPVGNLPVLDPTRVLHDRFLRRDVDERICP